MVLIRIADEFAGEMNGQYLKEYDPSRPGVSPEGWEMIAHVVTTPDPNEAMLFIDFTDAYECWRRKAGIRQDGEWNRPLTRFAIDVVGAPK